MIKTSAAPWHSRLGPIVVFALTLLAVWFVCLFVHELGHGLAAEIVGGSFQRMYVWPGIQLYPRLGPRYEGEWGTALAKTIYAIPGDWQDWQEGVVGLMGSGINLLLAILGLGSLWLFRPRGWLRTLAIATAFMYEDILLYAIFPELFGLPHYVFFGGSKPEPVTAAEQLGCPRPLAVVLMVAVSALITWGLIAYLRRHRRIAHAA